VSAVTYYVTPFEVVSKLRVIQSAIAGASFPEFSRLSKSDAREATRRYFLSTLRLVATAGARRASAVPELPTVAEQGFPGFTLDAWYGIVAPAGTPAEVVATLSKALSEMLRSPEFRQRVTRLGYDPQDDNAAGLDVMIRGDIAKYSALIKRSNIVAAP
jgi:tripartite-type tricarboxylate transporter receptor subunit TctC